MCPNVTLIFVSNVSSELCVKLQLHVAQQAAELVHGLRANLATFRRKRLGSQKPEKTQPEGL